MSSTKLSVLSNTPHVRFRGIRTDGVRNVALPVGSKPIIFPLFASFSPWGSYETPLAVSGSSLDLAFGHGLTDARTKWFNHQTLFMRTHFQGGGTAIFHRLRADGAKRATLRLSADIVQDELPVLERSYDGSIAFGQDGQPIDTGEKVIGYRIRYILEEIPMVDGLSQARKGKVRDGNLVAKADGATSKIYPLIDFVGRWEGAYGNNLGFRLSAPTISDSEPGSRELNAALDSFVYRLQMVERGGPNSSPWIIPTVFDEPFLNFTFKKNTVDLRTDRQYDLGQIFSKSYETGDLELFNGYSPLEQVYTYQDNLEKILTDLVAAEEEIGEIDVGDIHNFNFLTGVTVEDVPYHGLMIEDNGFGNGLFSNESSHFLKGGADGDVSTEALNQKWEDLIDGLESNPVPFEDIARLPFSVIYGSGFPFELTKKFNKFKIIRPDVFIAVSTQDVSKPLNSPAEDTSIARTLQSIFRATNESEEFGTSGARAVIVSGAGEFIDDTYTGIVPVLEWLVLRNAQYMGAGDGKMRSSAQFGRGEQNIVDRYRNHNVARKKLGARDVDYSNGVNYVEAYDMHRLFFAGLQSIYADKTDPLNGYFNMVICCNLTRIGHEVWREVTGDSQLEDGEFIDMVNEKFNRAVHEAYDQRAEITPNAHQTGFDNVLGFSYHLDVHALFSNAKTVQVLSIASGRRGQNQTGE